MQFSTPMTFVATIIGLIISTSGEQLSGKTTCFDAIKTLSKHDRALDTRSTDKKHIAPTTSSAHDFKEKMLKTKTSGKDFNCGETMAWVTELFEGVNTQYNEYKNGKRGRKAGYMNYIGQSLINFFTTQRSSKTQVIYHCQHVGSTDHVFTIHQFPEVDPCKGPTYKIYQSYNGAYSLLAWLDRKTSMNELVANKEVIIPHLTRCIKDRSDTDPQCGPLRGQWDMMLKLFSGKGGLNDEFIALNTNYSTTQAANFFNRSWSLYGKGDPLSESEFFNDYLRKTASVTEFYNEYSTTAVPHSKLIYDYWIELYASPDPMRYPELPSNVVSSQASANATYRFEIRHVAVPTSGDDLDAECTKNANILLNALPDKNVRTY